MVLLESEQFLTELTRLFQKCRTSGSVFITLKKYDGRTKPVPRKGHVESFEPADNKCLLRATDGKKKISTVSGEIVWREGGKLLLETRGRMDTGHMQNLHYENKWCGFLERKVMYTYTQALGDKEVSSKEVNKFQMAYSNLLRANMDGLKKKDKKSKNKKSKATQ